MSEDVSLPWKRYILLIAPDGKAYPVKIDTATYQLLVGIDLDNVGLAKDATLSGELTRVVKGDQGVVKQVSATDLRLDVRSTIEGDTVGLAKDATLSSDLPRRVKGFDGTAYRDIAIDADGHLQVDIVDPSGLATKDVPVRTLTIKDIDPTPVGDVLLKVLDQVLKVRDSGDTTDVDVACKGLTLSKATAIILTYPGEARIQRNVDSYNMLLIGATLWPRGCWIDLRGEGTATRPGNLEQGYGGQTAKLTTAQAAWFYMAPGLYTKRMFLDYVGNLYIDGSYRTFSPRLTKSPIEHIRDIISKPDAPRDELGHHICPIDGGRLDDKDHDPEHWEEYSRRYAKDISLLSVALGKLILAQQSKIEELERRIEALER